MQVLPERLWKVVGEAVVACTTNAPVFDFVNRGFIAEASLERERR